MTYEHNRVSEPILEESEEGWEDWWLVYVAGKWLPCLAYVYGGRLLIYTWDGIEGCEPADVGEYFTGPIPEPEEAP